MARRNPDTMAFDWALSSACAAATMWHRLSMFGAVGLMSETERQAEAARMVSEKMAAAYVGGWKAGLAATQAMWGAALGKQPTATTPLAIVDAAVRPAFRKTRANARRLTKRSLKTSR
jgi:hypothetical protein